MPIRRGVVAASITELPTVTINAVNNFNQDRATFNATVSANYQSTTVKFQYNTTNNFAAYTEVTATGSPVTGQSVAVYYNITGLSAATTYYVRAVISNGIGTVTTASTSFTTWSLKTYLNSTAGSYSVSVPSITPTGGSAITPTITEMLIYGAGGGANYSGGGGGGYRIASSKVSSSGGTQNITGTVGAAGAGGNGNIDTATAGGATTLVIGNTTYTANGGSPGRWYTPTDGSSGAGDNPSRAAGTGNFGYVYISGYNQMTVCDAYDKYGNCTASHQENDPNSPIYSTDFSKAAGGGGGGTDTVGGNHTYPDIGGNGGNGGGAYGLNGGNGGRGYGTASSGSNGSVVGGGTVVGTGGAGAFGAGVAGGVTFKYYGP